jgi:predicted nucleic acid-binding protein
VKVGLTFDTGALIALERRRPAAQKVYEAARSDGRTVTVPTAVIVEWWRLGRREKQRAALLRLLRIEQLSDPIARAAGVAIGLIGASSIDAIVMASAATRRDVVYTSDVDDLERLREVFPLVRVERI